MELVYELGHLSLETLKREVEPLRQSYMRTGSPLDMLFGSEGWFSVRDPYWHCMTVDYNGDIPDAEDWHQDGQNMSVYWMALWSNHLPTYLRRRDTFQEITMQPYTLTLIDNQRCEHRAPRLTQWDCGQRWLIRSHIYEDLTKARIYHAMDLLATLDNHQSNW